MNFWDLNKMTRMGKTFWEKEKLGVEGGLFE
jgi:hypothetical protein